MTNILFFNTPTRENIYLNTIKRFKPDIIASSAKTTEYLPVKDLMEKIKDKYPEIMTIVGGVHITVFPEEAIKEKCFDILVIGEGDKTIPDILSTKKLSDVPGIVYRDKKLRKIIFTKKRELIQDIN